VGQVVAELKLALALVELVIHLLLILLKVMLVEQVQPTILQAHV
jgi:hypothetical protein